jgi:hypothetical protein
MSGADVSADLDPAAIGQPRIEQGDVRPRGRNTSQRLASVRGFPDDLHIVRGTEQVGEAPSDELMVVEDEDPDDALVVYIESGIDHRSRRPPCSWFSRVNVPPRL